METKLTCSNCGDPLPDRTADGYEAVPEDSQNKLLCEHCYGCEDDEDA